MKNTFRFYALLAGFFALTMLSSCDKKGGYENTSGGLRYRFYNERQDSSKWAKQGDIITFHFTASSADSMFMNSYTNNNPAMIPLYAPTYNGCIFEGFAMMGAGDSASFVVNADSLFINTFKSSRPAFLKSGEDVTFTVKMVDIKTKAQMQEKMMKEMGEKLSEESAAIAKWFKDNNLTPDSIPSGLKYVITKKTKGRQAKKGDNVTVRYSGKFLDGTIFDPGERPYPVIIGESPVIQGWHDGLPLLKEGEKAIFVIPFSLAYGAEGRRPVIPAFATLVFDMEIVKIENPLP